MLFRRNFSRMQEVHMSVSVFHCSGYIKYSCVDRLLLAFNTVSVAISNISIDVLYISKCREYLRLSSMLCL